jgi:hypothetical protein
LHKVRVKGHAYQHGWIIMVGIQRARLDLIDREVDIAGDAVLVVVDEAEVVAGVAEAEAFK